MLFKRATLAAMIAALPFSEVSAEEAIVMPEVVVKGARQNVPPMPLNESGVDENTLQALIPATSDTASLLRDVPGVSLYGTGGDAGDQAAGNNSSTSTFNIIGGGSAPDLTIVKTAPGPWTGVGAVGNFSITVTNNGTGSTIGPITVTDTLPSYLDYVSFSGTNWACSYSYSPARLITCTYSGVLAAGVSSTILTITVIPNARPGGGNASNSAQVSTPGETNTANNSSTVNFSIPNAGAARDIQVTKTVSASPSYLGENFNFTLQVRNASAIATVGRTIVTDVLPPNVTYVSVTGRNWTCSYDSAARTLTCYTGTVIPAASNANPITVNVTASTTGNNINNTAAVTAPTA